MGRPTGSEYRKGDSFTKRRERVARETFERDLDAAHEAGDTELVEMLTDLGHEHGFLEPPTEKDTFNEAIRAAVRGRDVDAFRARLRGAPERRERPR
jgi:hypothetical protein